MFKIFFALILGVLVGTITGIIPGLHINLIAALVLTMPKIDIIFLLCFLVSMAITHTFMDFIPSIFLGLPKEDNFLALLPGHRFLIKGYGYAAAKLTLIGSFFGCILAIIFSPIYMKFISFSWIFLKKTVPFFLLFVSIFLIFKENKKIVALIVFLLSGILGILTLNFKLISQPLLPLFSGLFGLPLLFLSIKNKIKIKKQKIKEIKVKKHEYIKSLSAGLISSGLVSIYPSLGPGQAAIIGSEMFGKLNTKSFLILVGSINTIVMIFSFVSAYAIKKGRTGIAATILNILSEISLKDLIFILIVSLIASCLCVFIFILISKYIAKNINKINYSILCLIGIICILVINILVSGVASLIVLFTGLFIGLIANIKEIRKVHLMGCLVIPVLGFYF
ncbi:MAG: tripartite tricarboxylate transporter permease [Candidatus Pacearchaeota archaeon]